MAAAARASLSRCGRRQLTPAAALYSLPMTARVTLAIPRRRYRASISEYLVERRRRSPERGTCVHRGARLDLAACGTPSSTSPSATARGGGGGRDACVPGPVLLIGAEPPPPGSRDRLRRERLHPYGRFSSRRTTWGDRTALGPGAAFLETRRPGGPCAVGDSPRLDEARAAARRRGRASAGRSVTPPSASSRSGCASGSLARLTRPVSADALRGVRSQSVPDEGPPHASHQLATVSSIGARALVRTATQLSRPLRHSTLHQHGPTAPSLPVPRRLQPGAPRLSTGPLSSLAPVLPPGQCQDLTLLPGGHASKSTPPRRVSRSHIGARRDRRRHRSRTAH